MKPRDEVGFTAVKIIKEVKRGPSGKPEPDNMWQTFKSEWDACRRLRHRNIVRFERVFWFVPKRCRRNAGGQHAAEPRRASSLH
eukprot:scaffold357224_cov47-Prasinocladus_malaysianus.AAC.1